MSVFADLYSEFRLLVSQYEANVKVTPLMFMRLLTVGMQKFQRETCYLEATATITKTNDEWVLPNNMLYEIELCDSDGKIIAGKSYSQLTRITETEGLNSDNLYLDRRKSSTSLSANLDGTIKTRFYAIWGRKIILSQDNNDTSLILKYIIDLHPFASTSNQWDTGDITTTWFPLQTYFDLRFRGMGMTFSLIPYERGILNYVLSEYMLIVGNFELAQYYSARFQEEILLAIKHKPIRFKGGTLDYNTSPYA